MEVSKPTKRGRRRMEMKKVEVETERSVTFTKRRKGLFNKAYELSELSGAKIAGFVISKQVKPYSCGDVDSILDQYLTGKVSDSGSKSNAAEVELIRRECNATRLKLEEEEKKQREEKTAEKARFWWEKGVDETVEEWLKEYEAALEQLKKNVDGKLEEMKREKAKASTSSAHYHDHDHYHYHQDLIGTVGPVHHDGFIHDDQYGVEDFLNFDWYGFNG